MKLRGAVIGAGLLLVILAGAWTISRARTFQLFGHLVHRGPTSERVVALTFDDGPTPAGTDSILDILEAKGATATFFVTGSELQANPDLGRRIVAAGHELGNHSYSHPRFLLRSQSSIRFEIETTDSLIRAAGQTGPIHFRPPYGKKLVGLPWYLHRTSRTTVMWDIEPDSDTEIAPTSERITDHVLSRATPGSIILLHVMYPSRRESLRAVGGIIDGLREAGYSFVTVSDLLSDDPGVTSSSSTSPS